MNKLCAFLALIVLFSASASASEYGQVIAPEGANLPESIKPYLPAVGRIRYLDSAQSVQAGSAFYIGNGLVITAGHILAGASEQGGMQPFERFKGNLGRISIHFGLTGPTRYFDREKLDRWFDPSDHPVPVEVLPTNAIVNEVLDAKWGEDSATLVARDYAVLKINKPWPEVQFSIDSDGSQVVNPGDTVYAYGSFQGRDPMFYESKVVDASGAFVAIELAGGPGYSGGPVIHAASGKVIGITSARVVLPNQDTSTPYPYTSVAVAQRIHFAFARTKNCEQLLKDAEGRAL